MEAVIVNCKQCGGEIQKSKTNQKKIFCSKICQVKHTRSVWKQNNPDKIKESYRKWNNSPNRILSKIKSRCKKRNIPFDLSLEDLEFPTHCPILGIKLIYNSEGQGYKPNIASVDRIIPELGYIKGNVKIISWKANVVKNDSTIEELQKVISYLERERGY